MAKTPKVYTRLSRNSVGLASYSSLWIAADHLMIVKSTGYSESYSRVLFRDIKGLFVIRTERQLWWMFVWGILTVIAGLRLGFVLEDGGRPIGSVVFVALGVAGLVINFLLGKSCRVHFITGVQTSVLPSLVRIKKTQRVLAKLQPLITAAQAELVQPAVEPAATPTPSEAPAPAQPEAEPPATEAPGT